MIHHGGTDGGPEPRYDFSTNANALGPNPVVHAAVRAADLSRYPDPRYGALQERLAAHHRVTAGSVVVGAGASELILRIVRVLGGPVLTLEPTFGEYARAARVAGEARLTTFSREAFLERLSEARLAFLGQPNNPTGELSDADFVREAARIARINGANLVIDLAYAPLADTPVPVPEGVLRLFAPNKAHGMTGVRAAYLLVPDADIADRLRAAAPAWVIGTAEEAFLLAHTEDGAQGWLQGGLFRLFVWRAALAQSLRALGYDVREGRANFLMAQLGEEAPARLREHGIRVRGLADKGMPSWTRLSAQPPDAVRALLQSLERVL